MLIYSGATVQLFKSLKSELLTAILEEKLGGKYAILHDPFP